MRICAVLLAALVLAGCPAELQDSNATHNHDSAGTGQGFGDEHGKTTDIGEKELVDGYKVVLRSVETELKSEGIFELDVQKGGEALSDANVTIWLGNTEGFELSPIAPCLWMDDRKTYDCHIQLPPDGVPADSRVWIRVRHGQTDAKTDFPFSK